MNIISNFVLFQIGWFACVLCAAKGYPWLGVWASIIIMLIYVSVNTRKKQALELLAYALLTGLVFDAIPVYLGWVDFPAMPYWSTALAPAWMLVLWGNLATTLNSSLGWLQNKPLLAASFGLIGGPLAYIAGQKLGAFNILQFNKMTIYLAVGWGLAMPMLFYLSNRKMSSKDSMFTESGIA
ncbi:MAG TPA: DUF2878 domain-containing protein [Methylophilus sp.]|nr:DUF2878 domain-containing protein [Methylophilus sp.]HQQ32865.1 DUF2878 domain-containing protein [Methylophilus sp.]